MTRWLRYTGGLLAAIWLCGCGPGTLARVNGQPLTAAMLNTRIAMARVIDPGGRTTSGSALQQLVNETVVLNWARSTRIPTPSAKDVADAIKTAEVAAGGQKAFAARLGAEKEDMAAFTAFVNNQLILEAAFRRVTAAIPSPSPTQVNAYYAAHQARYTTPSSVLAREIVVGTEPRARSLVDQLHHGASFSALAARDSTAAKGRAGGGSLGYVPLGATGSVPAPVASLLKRLKPGQLGIAHTRFGYSIVEVQAVKAGQPVPLSNVAGTIRSELLTERQNAVFQQFVKHLRSRAHVVIGA